jgi:hypothetical protein
VLPRDLGRFTLRVWWVDPAPHNANYRSRLHLEAPAPSISWYDAARPFPAENCIVSAPGKGIKMTLAFRSRPGDSAIAGFERRHGRWPTQKDFGSDNGLPGYATLWRRFGSVAAAVELARAEGPWRYLNSSESPRSARSSSVCLEISRRFQEDLAEILRKLGVCGGGPDTVHTPDSPSASTHRRCAELSFV